MPDQPASLAAALAELQQHLPRIGKDKEEAEFVRDYMTGHGIHLKHVKVKRVKR